jgi:hypothetical protein
MGGMATYSYTPDGAQLQATGAPVQPDQWGALMRQIAERRMQWEKEDREAQLRMRNVQVQASRRGPEPYSAGYQAGPPRSAPMPNASPAQHGASPIGQADPYGSVWDPRNPGFVPMKSPVGLGPGMIPGMGEDPRSLPLALRPKVAEQTPVGAQEDASRQKGQEFDWQSYLASLGQRQAAAMTPGTGATPGMDPFRQIAQATISQGQVTQNPTYRY